ncbi:B12-binding domain-containing radical SAM protein [Geothrix limicola]|uniref:B12-binding domain-containing radical SAM protein n=1 Tax=Geothrix limicola TaxID=2927978 RepID=UPI0025523CF4|nr:radical SAM protein [Geothrix limicola]
MGIKALLVYPEMPTTYWSMRYALPFLGRKAALPPLGLLTVAAMLPPEWELRLIDLNVERLDRKDIESADLVLTSAMLVQRPSFDALVQLCRQVGKPLVAGGPYPTSCHAQIEGVDHFVLGEAEVNLPAFLEDFKRGEAKPCYADPSHPDLARTPPPRFDLLKRRKYAGAALQYSRGCPHHCEFCDIVELFGHRPRTKSPAQFLSELDGLFDAGWRGSLFVVDDNFIGNRVEVRRLLPELARWQAEHHFPFSFYTEASLDLAADEALMDDMVRAGFNMVFVGIETPDSATLDAIGKRQNCHTDLLANVHAIQAKGLEVSGGFIVGFDGDRDDIFDRQIRFIHEAAIPTAMVGLLTALPKTKLHARLASEGRLLALSPGGNNTHDLDLNFVPRMNLQALRAGYKRVLSDVYRPSRYFARCLGLIRQMKHRKLISRRIRWPELRAFIHSLVRQTCSRYVVSYWTFLLRALWLRPLLAAEIVTMAVKGHHFITLTRSLMELERFKERLDQSRRDLEERLRRVLQDKTEGLAAWKARRDRLVARARARCNRLNPDFRQGALQAFEAFRIRVEALWEPSGAATSRP